MVSIYLQTKLIIGQWNSLLTVSQLVVLSHCTTSSFLVPAHVVS